MAEVLMICLLNASLCSSTNVFIFGRSLLETFPSLCYAVTSQINFLKTVMHAFDAKESPAAPRIMYMERFSSELFQRFKRNIRCF